MKVRPSVGREACCIQRGIFPIVLVLLAARGMMLSRRLFPWTRGVSDAAAQHVQFAQSCALRAGAGL